MTKLSCRDTGTVHKDSVTCDLTFQLHLTNILKWWHLVTMHASKGEWERVLSVSLFNST